MIRRVAFRTLLFAGMAIAASFSLPTTGFAQSCDTISNPFQYNECLARQAPGAASRGSRTRSAADPETTVRGRRGVATVDPDAGLQNRGISINRKSSRRVQAVIDPWQGARSAAPTRPKAPGRRKRR